jgi:Integrase core domain
VTTQASSVPPSSMRPSSESEPATWAGRPQTNGVVERVQETILDECWKPALARYLIPKYTGLRLDLDRYLDYYNTDRAHTGRWTKGRTPEQVIGKVKMWSR